MSGHLHDSPQRPVSDYREIERAPLLHHQDNATYGGTGSKQNTVIVVRQDEESGDSNDNSAAPIPPEENGTNSKISSNRLVVSIIAAMLIGVFISNADSSIVMATHATIGSEFHNMSNSSWILTSYILAMAVAQPLIGKLSDIYGRKTMIQVSYTLFAIGCVICGLSLSLSHLIVGRVISGFGGAGMTALVSIIITDLVPLREVASWRSYVNIISTMGRSLGGPLGGLFVDTIGWRWAFIGQAPLMVFSMFLVWITLRRTTTHGGAAEPDIPGKEQSRISRVDFLGAGLLAVTIFAFMLPFELGGQKVPWSHPLILILFAFSVGLAILFVLVESRWAKEPIFPLVLLRQKDIVASYGVMTFQTAAQAGMMFTVPLYFQISKGSSSTVAGAHLIPAVVGNAVGGLATGFLIQKFGKYKLLIILASVCSSLSYTLLILYWHGDTSTWESFYITPGGVGTGIALSATFVSITSAVDPMHMAIASSGLYFSVSLGSAIGLAGSTAVMQTALRLILECTVSNDIPGRRHIIKQSLDNIDFVNNLEGQLRKTVFGAYFKSLEYTHGVSLVFSITAFVLALLIREHKL